MKIDQSRLDRLVDGELNPEVRRQTIALLAQDPDGWQRCALTFLEAQAIRENFEVLSMSPPSTPTNTESTTAVSVSRFADRPDGVGRDFGQSQRRRGWLPWLAMAASVMLAFTWGRYGIYPSPAASPSGPSMPPAVAEAPRPEPTRGDRGQPSLVSFHPNVDMFAGQSAMPTDIEQQLRALGISVQRQHGLMPMMDQRGNQLIVPYEDVNFVPVNRSLR